MKYVAATFFILCLRVLSAQDCVWMAFAIDDWTDASKWSCGHVPGPGDVVVISSGRVHLKSEVMIKELRMTSGTIDSPYTLTVSDSAYLAGNPSFDVGLSVILDGNSEISVIALKNGSSLRINADDTIWTTNATIKDEGSGNLFDCRGTIIKTSSSNMSLSCPTQFLGAYFHVAGGTVTCSAGMNWTNSLIEILMGSTIRFNLSDHTISNTDICGEGTFQINAGTMNFSGGSFTTHFSQGFTTDNPVFNDLLGINPLSFHIKRGTFNCGADLIIEGDLVIDGTALLKANDFEISLGGQALLMNGTFQDGTLKLNQGGILKSLNLKDTAVLEVPSGQMLLINSNSSTGISEIGNQNLFKMDGTLTKRGTGSFIINCPVETNNAMIKIDTGKLTVVEPGTWNNSTIEISEVSTAGFHTGTQQFTNCNISGDGEFQSNGSTIHFTGGNITSGFRQMFAGITPVFHDHAGINPKHFNLSSGTFYAGPAVNVTGGFVLSFGTIRGQGQNFVVGDSAELISGAIDSLSLVLMDGGRLHGLNLKNKSTLTIPMGDTISISSNSTVSLTNTGNENLFNLQGVLMKSGSGTLNINTPGQYTNSICNVLEGNLQIHGASTWNNSEVILSSAGEFSWGLNTHDIDLTEVQIN